MDREWAPLDDEQLDSDIENARRRSRILDEREPRAVSARYNQRTGRIEVELADGCLFAFPAKSAEGLQDATASQLKQIEIVGDGYALHWDELDTDYTVPGLLAGRLGSRVWMREHARRAGSTRSAAKARAARANGRKGGRPRRNLGNKS